jgi:hypothetical protein
VCLGCPFPSPITAPPLPLLPCIAVVDTVWNPTTPGDFPGLYCTSLPEQPFLPGSHTLLLTTQWRRCSRRPCRAALAPPEQKRRLPAGTGYLLPAAHTCQQISWQTTDSHLSITMLCWPALPCSYAAVVAVDVDSGSVTRVTPANGASWSLLAARDGGLLWAGSGCICGAEACRPGCASAPRLITCDDDTSC